MCTSLGHVIKSKVCAIASRQPLTTDSTDNRQQSKLSELSLRARDSRLALHDPPEAHGVAGKLEAYGQRQWWWSLRAILFGRVAAQQQRERAVQRLIAGL